MRIEIIHEDKDVIVIYKPAGFATQTAHVAQADVVSELKRHIGGANPYVGVVHRLDQPVEGLLVFAKNKQAAARLTAQLQNASDKEKNTSEQAGTPGLNKHYYAVTAGTPLSKEGVLENLLYKNAENKAVIVETQIGAAKVGNTQGNAEKNRDKNETPKRASLSFRLVASANATEFVSQKSATEELSGQMPQIHLFDIKLHTGRFHQIRVQMAHAGMPLLGDVKYGNEASKFLSRALGVREVALCAYSIEFLHPTTGKRMAFKITPKGKVFGIK